MRRHQDFECNLEENRFPLLDPLCKNLELLHSLDYDPETLLLSSFVER